MRPNAHGAIGKNNAIFITDRVVWLSFNCVFTVLFCYENFQKTNCDNCNFNYDGLTLNETLFDLGKKVFSSFYEMNTEWSVYAFGKRILN